MKLRTRKPVPLFGIPIEESNNPFLSLPSNEAVVLTVKESREFRIEGVEAKAKIVEFVRRLEEVIGEKVCMSIKLEPIGYPLIEYVVVTQAILEVLGINVERTLDDVLEVDRALGFNKSLIGSLRLVLLRNTGIVYREGEGFVELPVSISRISVSEQEVDINTRRLPLLLKSLMIKCVGTTVIEAAKLLRASDIDGVRELLDLQDGLWYAVHTVKPKPPYHTLPDISGARYAHIELAE